MDKTCAGVVALAIAALAGTVWYLSAGSSSEWIITALATAVVVVPLIIWLPRRAFNRVAAAWGIGGVLGAYVFGVFIVSAAAVLTAILVAHRLRPR
jgi:hypothetical protein